MAISEILNIKVGADASQAIKEFQKLNREADKIGRQGSPAIASIGKALNVASTALAKFNLAIGGVMLIVDAFKQVEEVILSVNKAADEAARKEFDRIVKAAEATQEYTEQVRLLGNEYNLSAEKIHLAEQAAALMTNKLDDQRRIALELARAMGQDVPEALRKYTRSFDQSLNAVQQVQGLIAQHRLLTPREASVQGADRRRTRRSRGRARGADEIVFSEEEFEARDRELLGLAGAVLRPTSQGAINRHFGIYDETPLLAERLASGEGDIFAHFKPPIEPLEAFTNALRDTALQTSVAADAFSNLSGAFGEVGAAFAAGEMTAAKFTKSLAAAGLRTLADMASSEAKFYGAKAIAAFAAGNIPQGVGFTAASAAMFAAAGFINAKAGQMGSGGGGPGGGATPSAGAGGGFRPPATSQGGGGTTTIIQIGQGFVGEEKKLAEEIDRVQRRGQRSGIVRQGNGAVVFV